MDPSDDNGTSGRSFDADSKSKLLSSLLEGPLKNLPQSGAGGSLSGSPRNSFSLDENSDSNVKKEGRPSHNFIELDLLVRSKGSVGELEWEERIRWMKYEEEREGSGRWSKPRIPSFTFPSLLQLNSLLSSPQGLFIFLNGATGDWRRLATQMRDAMGESGLQTSGDFLRILTELGRNFTQGGKREWKGLLRKRHNNTPNKLRISQESTMGDTLLGGAVSATSITLSGSSGFVDNKSRQSKRRVLSDKGAELALILVIGDAVQVASKPFLIIAKLQETEMLEELTEVSGPIRFISILAVPPSLSLEMDAMEIGRTWGALLRSKNFYQAVRESSNKNEIQGAIKEYIQAGGVLPPGKWDPEDRFMHARTEKVAEENLIHPASDALVPTLPIDWDLQTEASPFQRTGRCFGGLIKDLKKRYPYYKSDIVDGFHFECFSAIMFMYFVGVGPNLTVGSLYGEKTDQLIGTSETLLSLSICGLVYSLVAAQPLIPLGPTGPLVIFDEVLFRFCVTYGVEFLPLRAWTGMWLLVISLIVVAFEGSVLVKYFTNFTQEIFAALTAIILMAESYLVLQRTYMANPIKAHQNTTIPKCESEPKGQPNTALFSTILLVGTFILAYNLKGVRKRKVLSPLLRRIVSDFSIPLALLVMTLVDLMLNICTKKTKVPDTFGVSQPDRRGWWVGPLEKGNVLRLDVLFGAIAPACLLFIIVFMTQQICQLLFTSKERHLTKGSGLHSDLIFLSVINMGCGLFGLPWQSAAFVRSIVHLNTLTVYTKPSVPGEKPEVIKVYEQRVSTFVVSFLFGLSTLLGFLLSRIPLAVQFGILFYMGVISLMGTQLWERMTLPFIPSDSRPPSEYTRKVRGWKIHLFTILQLFCVGVLYGVKSVKEISVLFPLVFILLVPLRFQLKRIGFTQEELEALDGKPPK